MKSEKNALNVNFKAFLVIFCVTGIIFLCYLSTLAAPLPIALSEVDRYEDSYVIVQGAVIDYREIQDTLILKIRDEQFNTLAIYVEQSNKNINIGDQICVTGKVERYGMTYELFARSDAALDIVKPWDNETLELQQLAAHPSVYDGIPVCVHCFVNTADTTWGVVADRFGEYELKVVGNTTGMEKNYEIQMKGTFIYDAHFGYEFDLKSWEFITVWID